MAKLDELLEVLTEELEGFKSSIKQMEAVSKKLNNSEIQGEIRSIKYNQDKLQKAQDSYFITQGKNLRELQQKVKRTKMIPKWLLIMSCITFFSALLISAYAIYEIRDSWDKQVLAYNKGKEVVIDKYDPFFKDNKKAYVEYLKWKKEQK